MEWIKLDTSFFSHPKAIQAGPQGRMLAIAGWCWTAKHELDGLIPSYALPQLAFEVGIPIDAAADAAKKLVQVGLWEPVFSDASGEIAEAWQVHNFAKRQLTREAIERRRDEARERQRRSREAREARRRAEAEGQPAASEGHEKSSDVTRDSHVSHVAEERRGEEKDIVAKPEFSVYSTHEDLTPLKRRSDEAEAPSDDTASKGLPIAPRNDALRDERFALARELCTLVNERYAAYAEQKPRAITVGQVRAMHGLLTSGPPGAKNDPVPEAKIRRLVDMVFTDGVEPTSRGFCWAKNIRTAESLRRNWDAARVWANGVLDERAKAGASRRVSRTGSSGVGDNPFDPPRGNG